MNNRGKGIVFLILSALSFSTMSLFIQLSGDINLVQKVFFRNAIALVLATAILLRTKTGFLWQKGNFKFLLLRSIFGTMGVFLNFYAIENLILSDATMLNKLTPFFVVIFSFVILKEKIKAWQGISIVVAFVGALFIINPTLITSIFTGEGVTTSLWSIASIVGVFGAISAGLAYTMIRLLSNRHERGPYIVFFFSAFSCVVTLPILFFTFEAMTGLEFLYLMCAGIAASMGQFTVTMAYANAPAKEISIFDYTQIIFAALYGFFIFGDIPNVYSIIGYFIIVGVAIFMFAKNKQATKLDSTANFKNAQATQTEKKQNSPTSENKTSQMQE